MTTDSTTRATAAIDRRELRRCLTDLFSRKETIRRIVSEAGLSLDNVPLEGGPADAWFHAIEEAFKGDQIEALVKLALDEYPANKTLLEVHVALLKANAPPAAPVEAAAPRSGTVASFDPRLPHFFVPFPPKGDAVIGRAENLALVRKQLMEGKRSAIGQAASFAGLGGLGKTQLAVEYAHTYRADYPGGVYWFTADGDLDAQLARLAREARWVSPESEARYQLDIAIQQIRTRSNCLIVFDNVEHIDQIAGLRPDSSATPHLLLTSRTTQPGFPPLPLDRLDEAQSLQMLASESGRSLDSDDDRSAAEKIAAQVDGLPLALELVGAYMRRYPEARWPEYAAQLAAQGVQAHALRVSLEHESFTQHEQGLHATLRISNRVLDETPMLRDVLDVLAWSGPASMGRSLLAAALAVEPVALMEAFDVAVSMRVLKREDATGNVEPRYRMHRLVREVRQLDMPLESKLSAWAEMPRRIGDWFEHRRDEFMELERFEAEIDHLQAWQSQARQLGLAREVVRLLWLRAYPPFHRGLHLQSQLLIRQALDTFHCSAVSDDLLLAHLLNDLGATMGMAGDHREALEHKLEALMIRRKLLGEQHPDTAFSLNNAGTSYGDLGDHHRALEYRLQALAIRRKTLGDWHPDTATSLDNVGRSYGSLGDLQKATEYLDQALKIRRGALGERHPDTAFSLNNVGLSHGSLGNHRKALEYGSQALEILRDVLGDRHPDTATALNNTGSSYGALGYHSKALEHQEQALATRREMLGEHHPNTLLSRRNVATCLINLNRKTAALLMVNAGLKYAPADPDLHRLRATLLGRRAPNPFPARNQRR